jgi:hypothetical protein
MQVNTVYPQLFLLDSLPTFAESVGSVTFFTATGDKSFTSLFCFITTSLVQCTDSPCGTIHSHESKSFTNLPRQLSMP